MQNVKQIICVFTAFVLLLTVCGCAEKSITQSTSTVSITNRESTDTSGSTSAEESKEIFASERTVNPEGGTKTERSLANTYYKLTVKKQLNAVFLGGSVTQGAGVGDLNWVGRVTSWLNANFSNAQINSYNEGIGSTGTYWGLFRTDRDVLNHKPDIVFIEFAINDMYQAFTETQSSMFLESMIRKINTAYPTCDIVLVLTTDESHIGAEFENSVAQQKAAKYYGVPIINVGNAMADCIKSTGKKWGDFYKDTAHPNADGYKIYADKIIEYLNGELVKSPKKATKAANHNLPKTTMVSSIITKTAVIMPNALNFTSWKKVSPANGYIFAGTKFNENYVPEKGGTETYTFNGTSFGILIHTKESADLYATIDNEKTVKIEVRGNKFDVERLLFDNLVPCKHTVKIECKGGAAYIGALLIGK